MDINNFKHNPLKRNYNAGNPKLRVLIDPYCPFSAIPKTDLTISFTSSTHSTFPEDERRRFSTVFGASGMFLKEKYEYKYNYLLFPKSLDAELTQSLKLPKEYVSNIPYYIEQLWEVYKHPLDMEPVSFNKYGTNIKGILDGHARWDYDWINIPSERENEASLSTDVDTTEITDASSVERSDSQILHPYQTACTPARIKQVVTQSVLGEDGNYVNQTTEVSKLKGIHWKVIKRTDTFRGEDFFIEFIRKTFSTDVLKIKPTELDKFQTDAYKYLDVWNVPEDLIDRSIDDPPPYNQGVLSYKTRLNTEDPQDVKISYEVDENSRKFFDLNNQAYYVVEFNVEGVADVEGYVPQGTLEEKINKDTYFLIINQNTNPTLIRAFGGVSYIISTYDKISGKQLIDMDRFRVSIRNHLGKLVVVFSGKEDEPWIIDAIKLHKNDSGIIMVPKGKLSIWGGNISSGFIFSPITYQEIGVATLPPGVNKHKIPYDLPGAKKISDVAAELYAGRIGTNGVLSKIRPDSIEGIDQDVKKLYTCDAQMVNHYEYNCDPLGGNSTVTKVLDKESFFYGRKDFFARELPEDAVDSLGASGLFSIVPDDPAQPDNVKSYRSAITVIKDGLGTLADPADTTGYFAAISFVVYLGMAAGSHLFVSEDLDGNEVKYHLRACKTPIIDTINMTNKDDEQPLWDTLGLNISHRVSDFSETWSSQDYFKIEHSGSMKIFLNEGPKLFQEDNNFNSSQIIQQIGGNVSSFLLEKLRHRAFYFTIDVKYEECIDSSSDRDQYYTQLNRQDNDGWIRLFTGICEKSTLTQSNGESYLECELKDYWSVMEKILFFNAPFFDGMRDINAVDEILKIANFRSEVDGNLIFPNPGFLIRTAAAANPVNGTFNIQNPVDGRSVIIQTYALPQSFDRLTGGAFFKPQDGDAVGEIIINFAKKANKVCFFDEYGVFHYENRKFDNHIFGISSDEIPPDWYYRVSPPDNNSSNESNWGQLVFNNLTRESAVYDVYNHINLISTTPNGEYLIAHNIDYAGIISRNNSNIFGPIFGDEPQDKPEGWLGYRKTFLQQEAIFGSEKALYNQLQNYSQFFKPPKIVRFESYGQPIRALDICQVNFPDLDGNKKFIVVNVSSSLNFENNKWWQNIDAEWIEGN